MRSAFPLAMAAEGERVRVVAVHGGNGFHRRLADMGLYVGCEICVRRLHGPGGLVVARGETRLALGEGLAHKIWVQRT